MPRRRIVPRGSPLAPYVWELPDEPPGTLAEIFDAEDSRAQNLVLYEIRKVDGFRRSWQAIGAPGDPYDLIDAVMSCINEHLHPSARPADYRHRMRLEASCARTAATPQEFLSSLSPGQQTAWLGRLKDLGLGYPADPRIIADLRNLAVGYESMLAGGAFKELGGRSSMAAFRRLVRELARVFEGATGRRPGVTQGPKGYSGKFWDFVQIVRPIVAAIITTSGAGPFTQPATDPSRGKFIWRTLREARATVFSPR